MILPKLFLSIILITISISCNAQKDKQSQLKMSASEDANGNKHLSFETKSKNATNFTKDLETVLDHLTKDFFLDNQLLFYIDATNGMIFISGYDSDAAESSDGNRITIVARYMGGDDASDFDEAAIKAIRNVFATAKGGEVRKQFKVYYQTEVEEPELLD